MDMFHMSKIFTSAWSVENTQQDKIEKLAAHA